MDDSGNRDGRLLPPRALLAAIVDSSFDGVISKTLDGTITSWNAGAERIFGFTPDEAIGRKITILVPPERLDEESWILERLRAGERVVNFGTVRVRKDGRRIDVAVTSSPVRNLLGEIVGASKIVRDVSDARAAASALAQSEARLAAIVDSAMDGIITVDALGVESEEIVHSRDPNHRRLVSKGRVWPMPVVVMDEGLQGQFAKR